MSPRLANMLGLGCIYFFRRELGAFGCVQRRDVSRWLPPSFYRKVTGHLGDTNGTRETVLLRGLQM